MDFSNSTLLELWDRLRSATPRRRNARIAAGFLALPVTQIHDEAPLGVVQAAIFRLYASAFGAVLQCNDTCPDCGSRVAADLPVDNLLASQESAPPLTGILSLDGWTIRYRAPSQRDLQTAGERPDSDAAMATLVQNIVIAVEYDDQPATVAEIPESVIQGLAERIETEDPLAAADVALSCPDCDASWVSGIEAGSLFQMQLDAWARRTLWDVHHLAMRYGWREQDILAMTPGRREAYLLLDSQ